MCLGSCGLCAHGEDVEDERGAVENFYLQLLFYIAYLLGGQLIVEDDHTYLALVLLLVLDVLLYLLEFSLAHIGSLVGCHHLLRKALHGDGSCGVGEKLQFVEVFLGFCLVLLLGHEAHEHGGFRLDL